MMKGSSEAEDRWEEYNGRNKLLGYVIRIRKARTPWKSYCESIESSNEGSRLRKILAKESNER